MNSYFCWRLPVGFGVLGGKKQEVLLISAIRPSIFASKDFTASLRSELLLLFSPIRLLTLSSFVSKVFRMTGKSWFALHVQLQLLTGGL